MSGALLVVASAEGSGGGGIPSGNGVLNSVSWPHIFGDTIGSNAAQTLGGISIPVSISAGLTGGASLGYSQTGSRTYYGPYTGAFAVQAGDTLSWYVYTGASSRKSGTATIVNVTDSSTTIATFTYVLTGSL